MPGYRIPYRMFFQWFVPYSRSANILVAVLAPVAVLLTYYAIFIRPEWSLPVWLKIFLWFPWGLGVFVSPLVLPAAAVFLFGYHRPITRRQALAMASAGWLVGASLIAAVSLREPQTLLWTLVACLPLVAAVGLLSQEAVQLRHLRSSPPRE